MKKLNNAKRVCSAENDIMYAVENGGLDIREGALFVRDVTIDAGIDDEVYIGFAADAHLNLCNRKDFEEADPVVMSTYENRRWGADGYNTYKLRNALSVLDDADLIVIGGDTLDYLSHGSMELMDNELWSKFPNVIAALGGHEAARQMEGKIEDTMPREQRLKILENYWRHDIYYFSTVVKNKVMAITMLNDLSMYTANQKTKLEADISLAREKGYVILIFQHEPIATGNPAHEALGRDDILRVGQDGGFPYDFMHGKFADGIMAGNAECDDVTKEVYSLITENADIVRGIFAGHLHQDMHLDILGHTPGGEKKTIPQFIINATAFDDGHSMRILVK